MDVHQPFLDELMCRARAAKLAEYIRPVRASMDALPFEPESFDIIWSEGAIYIMGFERGLRAWQPLVRHGGYVVVSEGSWLVSDPPASARAFWDAEYPAMRSVADNLATIKRCGYERLADFVLPKSAWLINYYEPLMRRTDVFEREQNGDRVAANLIAHQRREINLFSHAR